MDGQIVITELDTKEYLFLKLIGELDIKKNPNLTYHKPSNLVLIDYDNVWQEFQEILSLTYKKTSEYFKLYIEKYFNIKDVKVKIKDENITHVIIKLEDAIDILGNNDENVIKYKKIKELFPGDYIISELELVIITKALNEGWVPDWNNTNEKKWYSYWEWNPSTSRFVFVGSVFVYWSTDSVGGSRLCFREESLAAFAANRFPQIYNGWLLYNK